jgi:hypothetical protein
MSIFMTIDINGGEKAEPEGARFTEMVGTPEGVAGYEPLL